MSKKVYDVVIVGAGSAGCVVASYLAEPTSLILNSDIERAWRRSGEGVPRKCEILTVIQVNEFEPPVGRQFPIGDAL